MVEINETERKKELKEITTTSETSGTMLNTPTFESQDSQKKKTKKKDYEKILEEIIVENFPKMGKEIAIQVQETQRVPNRINPRQNTPRHILIKLTKIKHKECISKAAREKQQITYKGIPTMITADLSTETLQDRREQLQQSSLS